MLSEDFDVVNFSNTRLGIGVHESKDSGSDVWHENKDSRSELLLFFWFKYRKSIMQGRIGFVGFSKNAMPIFLIRWQYFLMFL